MSAFKGKATSNQAVEVPPAGSHPAVLVGLIDLGTHQRTYQGQDQGEAPQIYLVWELTSEPCPGTNRNHVLGRQFTNSLNKKAKLRLFIESWSGRQLQEGEEFDYSKMLGKSCLLNVVHKQSGDYTNANIESVSKPPKGMTVPPAKIETYSWEIGCGKPLPELPWLPPIFGKSVKQVIEASREYTNGTAANGNGKHAEAELAEADEAPF